MQASVLGVVACSLVLRPSEPIQSLLILSGQPRPVIEVCSSTPLGSIPVGPVRVANSDPRRAA